MILKQLFNPFLEYKKYWVLLFIFILASKFSVSQSILNYNNIAVVNNIDSMEKLIPSKKALSIDYINFLITIEENRYRIVSGYFGNHIKEIDSLSELKNYTFGTACAFYFKSFYSLKISSGNVRAVLQYGEIALQIFEQLKDEVGAFNTKIVLITASTLIKKEDKVDELTNNNKNFQLEIYQQYCNEREKFIKETYQFAKEQTSKKYLYRWNHNQATISFNETDEKYKKANEKRIRGLLISNLNIIKQNQELKYQQVYLYNKIAAAHSGNERMHYLQIGLQQEAHSEDYTKATISIQIATCYVDKNNNDSALYYALMARKMLEKFTKKPTGLYTSVNSILSDIYAKKNNFKQAYFYRSEAFNLTAYNLSNQDQNLEKLVTNSYLEYEKLKTQIIKYQQINAEKKISNQRIKIVGIALGILSLAFLYIFWSNKKLIAAKKQIETLQHTREKFYSIVVHDLRNPIKNYQGLASKISYLLKNNQHAEIDEITKKIDATGNNLDIMFQNLLNWSLNQQNNLNYNPQKIIVKDCILNLLKIYQPIADEKNVTIKCQLNFSDYILADEHCLTTILRNLLDNAVKNSIENSIIIIKLLEQKGNIIFTIQNKTFIEQEKLQIIESLFTSKKEWHVGEKGLGLGLILIREFTQKMGGKIKVNNISNIISFELLIPFSNN